MGEKDKIELKGLAKYGFKEEIAEEVTLQAKMAPHNTGYSPTGFPKAVKRYRLMHESFNMSIEEMYYWTISQLRRDQSYNDIEKITDVFSASEQSAFWGAAQQRLSIQQDRVSQYMASIGKMVKDLFQLVRELRIIDERLEIYNNWKESKRADVTLKGLYVDLVEGASKNPASVYGLAQTVGFTTLPDLFFNTHAYSLEAVDRKVDGMKFNTSLKNVLRRKLYSYINWKEKTHKEMDSRRTFQLKYLRQHWDTIKMYMAWIKPHLRNIRRLQMKEKHIMGPDLISAFESSMIEIEILAKKPPIKGVHPVILATFEFRTRSELSHQQDNYAHRGPSHTGRGIMTLRTYAWTQEEIDNYKSYRDDETMELYSIIDDSVRAAMESLGDELEDYLKEAGEKVNIKKEQEKENKPRNLGMLDPFVSVAKGFGEIFTSLAPMDLFKREKGEKKVGPPPSSARKTAAGVAKTNMWLVYKNYKKAHKMITW